MAQSSGHIKVTITWPPRLRDHLPIWTVPSEPPIPMVTFHGRVRTGTAAGFYQATTIQVSARLCSYLEAQWKRTCPQAPSGGWQNLSPCGCGTVHLCACHLAAGGCHQPLGVSHSTLPGGLPKHSCLPHEASWQRLRCPILCTLHPSCVLLLAPTVLPKSCRGSEPRAPSPKATTVPFSSECPGRPQRFRGSPGLGGVSALTR